MSRAWASFFLLLLALAVLAGGRSRAASDDEDTLFFGGEVTTPSRRPQPMEEAPSPVTVITRDDIRRSGAQTLPEVLLLAPGVSVVRRSEGEVEVSIRGFSGSGGNKVLVLLDSRPLFNLADNSLNWNLLPVPIDAIERVEIARGSGSAMYGENAFFGTINIITRDGSQDRGLAAAGYGAGPSYQAVGGFEYRQSSFHAEYLALDRFGGRESSVPNNFLGGTKPFAARVDIERAFGRLDRADRGLSLSGGVAFANADYDELITRDRMAFLAYDQAFRAGGVDYGFGARVLGQDRQVDKPGFPDEPYQRYLRADIDFKAVYQPAVFDVLLVGVDLSRRAMEDQIFLPDDWRQIEQYAVSGYIENQLALADRRVLLTAGVRGDGYEDMRGAVSPRAGVVVILSPQQSIKLGWGRAYRSPSIFELHQLDTLSPPWVFRGNPGLRPESVSSWNLDYFYQDHRRSLSLTLYHHELDDLIVYRLDDPTLTERPYRLTNQDRALSYGAEAEGRARLTDRLTGWGNYSYNEAYYLGDENVVPPFSPRHLANAGLDYRTAGWRASVWAHYSGSQQAVVFDAPFDGRVELRDYATVSARLEVSLPADLSASVMFSDLGGAGHFEAPNFAPVGPYYFVQLRWEPGDR